MNEWKNILDKLAATKPTYAIGNCKQDWTMDCSGATEWSLKPQADYLFELIQKREDKTHVYNLRKDITEDAIMKLLRDDD